MRILVIAPRFHSNLVGVDRAFWHSNISVTFLTSHIGPSERESKGSQIVIPENERSDSWCREMLEHTRPDILVVRETTRSSRTIWYLAQGLSIPCVFYDQGPVNLGIFYLFIHPFKSLIFLLGLFRRFLLFGPNLRITPVKSWGEKGLVPLPNSKFLPMPIFLARPKGTISKHASPVVVCVAKHGHRRKRVQWLLRALAQCPLQFRLILVGSSPNSKTSVKRHQHVLRTVDALQKIGHDVQIVSDVSETEILEVLARADLFVLPSRAEPFAISPLEAMAMRLPVLVSADSGNAHQIIEGLNGAKFLSRSYLSFYRKLTQLLDNKELLKMMGVAGFSIVRQLHSQEEFIRRFREMRRDSPCEL